MLTVALVLKVEPGSPYGVEDVRLLAGGVRRHLDAPARIVLLTDAPAEDGARSGADEVLPLRLGFRGWWSKMEVFALRGPVLYLDLDTVAVGGLGPFARAAEDATRLLLLRGFHGERRPCSGVMGWGEYVDVLWLLEEFAREAASSTFRYVSAFRALKAWTPTGTYRGDQDWIAAALERRREPWGFVQDRAPGIYSYKADLRVARPMGTLPGDARLVVFHGDPRPRAVLPRPAWLEEAWGEGVTA